MLKKFISIAIVLALIFSMSGCAWVNGKTTAAKEPAQTTSSSTAPAVTANTDTAAPQTPAAAVPTNETPAAQAAPAKDAPAKQPESKPQESANQGSATTTSTKPAAVQNNIFGVSSIEFTLKNLDNIKCGSKNIFASNKLTMINFWGTMCIPCIEELPELQALSEEMQSKGIGVIGIVSDITEDEGKEDAKAIIGKKGVTYINLVPDEKVNQDLISKITGLPVSVFVDSNGNIVGEVITGARSKAEYKKIAEKILSTLK